MTVCHQATVNGYHKSVWFSENAITYIKALMKLCHQNLVTYRSNYIVLIVHR